MENKNIISNYSEHDEYLYKRESYMVLYEKDYQDKEEENEIIFDLNLVV